MKKNQLLKKLDEAIQVEEDAYPIYAEHLVAAVEWTGLSPKFQSEVIVILEKLKNETAKHKVTFQKMKDYVLKENRDVF